VTAPPVDGSAHRYPSRVRAAPQRLGEEGHATTAIGVKDELAWPWQVAADDGGTAWPRADNPVGAAIVAHAGSNPDKMTLAQAKKAHDWPAFDAATRQEVDSLWNNGTLELADLPAGATVLPIQIICERKRGADRQLTRHKSRAVARGDRQLYGRDYTDVFAPVVRRATLLSVLALATARRLHMLQLDIETAFLNGHLDETIYVQQPKGYERGDPNKVCRLRKALYGLKQAARQWFIELVKLMDTMGMTQSQADPCLFHKDVSGERAFLLVYVDDLLLVASTAPPLAAMRDAVLAAFQARDLGKPTYFLGLHVDRDEEAGTMVVSQRSFTMTLLERHGMADAKPVALPMAVGTELRKAGEGLAPAGVMEFQTMIGGLLYLSANTRPDIAYAVGRLARYASAPTTTHVTLTKRIMRYLRGTVDWGLRFGAVAPLLGYCDADFAGDLDTRRSTSGYAFTLHGGAVSWGSKVQPTVAASTMEAEYMAAAVAAKEAVWLRRLLGELKEQTPPVHMRCDNQSALKLIDNPCGTARSKHIDVTHHFVRDRVRSGDLVFSYIPSVQMVADVLTKALPLATLLVCRAALGMVSPTTTSAHPVGSVDSGEPNNLAVPTIGDPGDRSRDGGKGVTWGAVTDAE